MDCRQCVDNLTAYLDGELDPAESAGIRLHLEGCASCAAESSGLREAAAFVESHGRDLEIGPGSWNAVYDRISRERPASRFRFFIPKRIEILAAACVAVALVFGYLWYQHDQRRGIENYIAQYVKSREAGFGLQTMNAVVLNPFAEARPSSDKNPFRLEDR